VLGIGSEGRMNTPWRQLEPELKHERFLHAFRNKGRLSVVPERMPVHVILNPKAALMGAAYHGLQNEGAR
jgi:glucokinase